MTGPGRYAPSPSGELHVGNLRTALAAWLVARAAGEQFFLRIDDLDPERSRSDVAAQQLDDLAALGIDWDGEIVRQSTRGAAYAWALDDLRALDAVYPCFCTRADIRAAARAPHDAAEAGLGPDAYPGTCASLGASTSWARVTRGEEACLRVRADAARVVFTDALLGPIGAVVDDFVVRRKDGVAAYNLACVVDDAAQGVGHVVRGADLAPTTPRQIWLTHALQRSTPAYGHVPLVVGPDGERLAKRHGEGTSIELREGPDAAARLRARLARSLGVEDADPSWPLARLVAAFDPANIPRTRVDATRLAPSSNP